MLKSTAPIQEEEEDPLAYYEKHTSQIEARPVCCWVASTHTADESHVCSGCLVPGYSAPGAFPSLCLLKADGSFVLHRAGGSSRARWVLGEHRVPPDPSFLSPQQLGCSGSSPILACWCGPRAVSVHPSTATQGCLCWVEL